MGGSRNFCQAGGGVVEARRPENSLDNVFLVINLFYNLQSGSNDFITEGQRGGGGLTSSRGWGSPKKPIKLVIFQGGGGVRTP